MKQNTRWFHHSLALWIALPLLVSLSTGLIYRIGRTWFGMTKPTGKEILKFHTGAWLGEWPSHLYMLVCGLGLLAMVLTGLAMLRTSRSTQRPRVFHRIAGGLLLLPLLATATTGLAYHFGEAFFNLSEPSGKWLMKIHQGAWLGEAVKPFYVIFVGVGLLFLIVTGLRMLPFFQKSRVPRG